MQQAISIAPQTRRGGGRASSIQYRHSLSLCDDFAGLEEDTNRYQLLLLVKRVGKAAGFTPRMIQLLDYYMAFTRDQDWEGGSRPIVFQSVAKTAMDLGVSERQVQHLEKRLFDAGVIAWHDSGNHKRFGQRDPATGRLIYAFGVDLAPLSFLREELEDKLQKKELHDQAWMDAKRQITWFRRQIRAMLLELEEGASTDLRFYQQQYASIAIQLRTHMSLEQVRSLLRDHEALHQSLSDCVQPSQQAEKTSCTSERNCGHNNTSNQSINSCSAPGTRSFQESVVEASEPEDLASGAGLQHVTLKIVLQAASDRFRGYLPVEPRPTSWADAVEAAHRLLPALKISQEQWGEACSLLGRAGAAVCVVITDQGMHREADRVRHPAAYFRGMLNKARGRELRLHSSIFGLTELTPQ